MHLLVGNNELYQGARGWNFPFSSRALNGFLRSNCFKLSERRITEEQGAVIFCNSTVLFMDCRTIVIFPCVLQQHFRGPCVLW